MRRHQLPIEQLEPRRLLADAPVVGLNVRKADASETSPLAAGLGQFTVRRSGDTGGVLDVAVRTSPGASTATSGADFRPVVRFVRLGRGRAHAHFNLTPLDDRLGESTETVVLKAMPSSAYALNPARTSVRLNIADNEPTVGIRATDPVADETDGAGEGSGMFTVRRSGSTSRPLVVGY